MAGDGCAPVRYSMCSEGEGEFSARGFTIRAARASSIKPYADSDRTTAVVLDREISTGQVRIYYQRGLPRRCAFAASSSV